MTMPWFKLYNEFATDPKVQMLSEAMQRRLIMIFCLRSNETLETLHETEVAFHLRITETELQQTKQLFIQKGFIDDDWNVLNWEYRQQAFSTSTERVRKHRIKQKQQLNGNETPIETNETLHVTPETLHANARLEEDIDIDEEEDIKKTKAKKIEKIVLPDWINQNDWNDFLEMRKSIKKSPTERAKALIINKLEKFYSAGADVSAILNQSTMNCWQDIYEIKQPQTNQPKGNNDYGQRKSQYPNKAEQFAAATARTIAAIERGEL
jgi:hypothetical protein